MKRKNQFGVNDLHAADCGHPDECRYVYFYSLYAAGYFVGSELTGSTSHFYWK